MSTSACEELPALPAVKVSFQSSTANAWAGSFLRSLNAELDPFHEAGARRLMPRVCHTAQSRFNAQCHVLSDTQSRTVLGMCVLMLSAYQELSAEFGSTGQAFDLVARSFDQAYQAFIQNICKPLLLNAHRSPRMLAGMNFKAWSECMYAPDHQRQNLARSADTTGYQHFFLLHDASELAQIIQRADQAWIEAVAAYGQSCAGERRSTRASADMGFVPFRFAAGGRARPARKPDVVLELQINVATDRRGNPAAADRRHHWDGIDRRQSARRQDDGRLCF